MIIDHALGVQEQDTAAGAAARDVRDLARSALDVLSRDVPPMPRVRSHAAELDRRLPADRALSEEVAAIEITSAVRHPPPDDAAWQRSSVDLVQIPGRVVDDEPDSVRWRTVEAADGPHVEVVVDAGRAASRAAAPWARAYMDGGQLPVAVGRMTLTMESGRPQWTARLPLPVGMRHPPDVIDVFSPRIARRPRLGAERRRAEFERDAVDLVVRLRTLVASTATARRRAVATSAGILADQMAQLPGQPDPLIRRLNVLSSRAPDDDFDPAAWRLTLAERALQRPDLLGPRYRHPV